MNACPLEPMPHAEKARLRKAAFQATRLWPGPVGEFLSREILTWDQFGYRLSGHGPLWRLVAEIEKRHEHMLAEKTYG